MLSSRRDWWPSHLSLNKDMTQTGLTIQYILELYRTVPSVPNGIELVQYLTVLNGTRTVPNSAKHTKRAKLTSVPNVQTYRTYKPTKAANLPNLRTYEPTKPMNLPNLRTYRMHRMYERNERTELRLYLTILNGTQTVPNHTKHTKCTK